jgi:low affinity Fe/Cu permease
MLIDQVIFNWAVAVAGFLGGWVLKVIWDAITDLKKDIRAMDTKMHEDFVRRDDFKDAMIHVQKDMDEIKADMKEGFRTVNNTLGLIFKKLDHKEDKNV